MEKSMLSTPEYVEKNGNVYLTLRNKIRNHTKTISDTVLSIIQDNWASYNLTQKRILQYLFHHNQATIKELVDVTGIHEKNVRLYLNQFMENEKIINRLSEKQRDKNAKYAYKKH